MQHYSLFELNKLIRNTLDKHLEASYWVVAEIGEMRVNQKGHCYLDLVEKADDQVIAKSRASIWAYNYRKISSWFESITRQSLKAGMNILANVVVQFHELYGFCLIIRDIDPNFTLGERARKKQAVIDQLKREGVFELNKSIPLPLVPQKVAVISSPTAAGFGDFVDQLQRNKEGYFFNIKLFKAVMQGEEAVESILQALHQIFAQIDRYDVVAILRGGGAQVDLDCFDTYDLSAHIAQFPLPVITGIGHERDETISDMVAHTKMKTPTAVSEFLLSGMRAFEENIEFLFERITNSAKDMLLYEKNKLATISQNVRFYTHHHLNKEKSQLEGYEQKIKSGSLNYIKQQKDKILYLGKAVDLLDPKNILKRGYTITQKNGVIIKNVQDLKTDDQIETIGHDQIIYSIVKKIEQK